MRTPRRRSSLAALLALAGALALAGTAAPAVSEWRSVLGERPKAAAQRVIVVLAAPSLADRVASAPETPTRAEERRWTREAGRAQLALLSALRRRGVRIRPELVFTRTLNGFSAELDARALTEVERAPGVLGVYPVRTVYPASASAEVLVRPEFGESGGHRHDVSLPGYDGSGILIALLDTGVDLGHPFLRGRVLPGWDVVSGDRLAAAEAKPGEPGRLESHGTRLAGLLVGDGGPAGLRGVVPGARILPIRVLGWQQADDGSYAVLGRGDQLLAGLERSVDPDGDGDAHDAVRIALAALVEPYASFADAPEARAVAGAARLGTLVVAAAGNDGPAGAGFGSIGAPGGAAAALTAGALDLRRDVLEAPVAVRAGGQELLARPARLLGAVGPDALGTLRLVPLLDPARGAGAVASGTAAADFLDPAGGSLVEGAAALVPADARPLAEKARNAAAAGAAALAVYGTILPTGGLDLDDAAPLPVVALPAPVGRAVAAAGEGAVSLGAARAVANPGFQAVASFSSRGLALDGRVKPDVVAAGVGLATADAGRNPDGTPRYATVTGTSAAAALVAGAAALVAKARPGLGAAALKGVLVGGARAATADPVTAQGAGQIDPAAAAAAELAVEPATLAFGRTDGGSWRAVRVIAIRNLSERRLRVEVVGGGAAGVTVSARPRELTLRPGAVREVRIVARTRAGTEGLASGVLLVRGGTGPARIPWAVALGAARGGPLVSGVVLAPISFTPSLDTLAVLAFSAGRVRPTADADSIDPVAVLELELWSRGRRLGVVARLRDLLPGRYAVGLTGRGPDGRKLAAGRYVVRLRARPVDGGSDGDLSYEQASFTIVRPAETP